MASSNVRALGKGISFVDAVEDYGCFLERAALGLDDEEVYECCFQYVPRLIRRNQYRIEGCI